MYEPVLSWAIVSRNLFMCLGHQQVLHLNPPAVWQCLHPFLGALSQHKLWQDLLYLLYLLLRLTSSLKYRCQTTAFVLTCCFG